MYISIKINTEGKMVKYLEVAEWWFWNHPALAGIVCAAVAIGLMMANARRNNGLNLED